MSSTNNIRNNEDIREDGGNKESRNNKYKVIILLILFLLFMTLIVCGSYNIVKEKQLSKTIPEKGTISLENSADASGWDNEEIQRRVNQQVADGYFNATMNTELKLKDGKSKANLYIYNNPSNKYNTIVELKDNKDNIIYTSNLVKPGYKIEEDVLDKQLSKGKHEYIAQFNIYEGEKYINNMKIKVNIEVEN